MHTQNQPGYFTFYALSSILIWAWFKRTEAFSFEAAEGWQTVFEELEKQDHKMEKDYREQIDTMLVFVREAIEPMRFQAELFHDRPACFPLS
jgi:hypothetical protein